MTRKDQVDNEDVPNQKKRKFELDNGDPYPESKRCKKCKLNNLHGDTKWYIIVIVLCSIANCTVAQQPQTDHFKSLGCNVEPITQQNFIVTNGYTIPCDYNNNCQMLNTSIIQSTIVFPIATDSVICLATINQTEYNATHQFGMAVPSMYYVGIGNTTVIYPLIERYIGAVNIRFNNKGTCACPDGLAGLKCYEGFNYCEDNNLCTNVYQPGIYSDCFENNLGPFSKPGHACAMSEFSDHEEATFYYIDSPILSVLEKVSIRDYYYLCGNVTGCFITNGFWRNYTDVQTFPVTQNVSFSAYVDPNANYYTFGWYKPSGNFTFSFLGNFDKQNWQGKVVLATYKGEDYYVPNANRINEYDVTKCGWLKKDQRGVHQLDKTLIAKSMTLNISSCVDDKMSVESDVTACDTSKWIKLADLIKPWGYPHDNLTNSSQAGIFSLDTTTTSTGLMKFNVQQNIITASFTYGVSSFNCSAQTSFRSSVITCDVIYTPGAKFIMVSVISSNNELISEQNPSVTGTGDDVVNITIFANQIKNTDKICMQSDNGTPKCMKITVTGTDLQVTNPNWNIKINAPPPPTSEEGSGTNWDFFDWSTWGDKLWATILSWIAVGIVAIIVITLAVLALPVLYEIYTTRALNRVYHKLMRTGKGNDEMKSLNNDKEEENDTL